MPAKADDPSDNARSVAFVLAYGSFDFFDAGDLTWNTEAKLVLPGQRGTGRRRLSGDAPRPGHQQPPAAAAGAGADRGGDEQRTEEGRVGRRPCSALKALPSLQALYQLHRNVATGPDDNTTPDLIANLEETPDAGHMVSVHVQADGSYEVVNHRTGEKRAFASAK